MLLRDWLSSRPGRERGVSRSLRRWAGAARRPPGRSPAVLVVAAAASLLVRSPFKGYAGDSVVVEIPSGTSTRAILETLEREGVLRTGGSASSRSGVSFRGQTLKAGEYRFAGPKTTEQVLRTLVEGDVVTYRITIPEGLTADEIFGLVAGQGLATKADSHALFAQPGRLRRSPGRGADASRGSSSPTPTSSPGRRARAEIVSTLMRLLRAVRFRTASRSGPARSGGRPSRPSPSPRSSRRRPPSPTERAARLGRLPQPPAGRDAPPVRPDDDLRPEAPRGSGRAP